MSIAEVIKQKAKKRKKTPDNPSFFESPLWKRVEEHAKDWDNRGTAQRALKSIKKQKKEKAIDEEPVMARGVSPSSEMKPREPDKRVKEPMEATPPSKPDKRAPKRNQMAEKPKSEFLEKYYGKDWA